MPRVIILLNVAMITTALALAACRSAPAVDEPASGSVEQSAGDALSVNSLGLAKNRDGYADISVADLVALMEAHDVLLVNTHVPYEGDIPGTDVSIPFDAIDDLVDQLPADSEQPVVLYCRSGNMSTEAATRLADLGYSNILELDGGFKAWQAAGFDLAMQP